MPNNNFLLTIAVPTFNRAHSLDKLLGFFEKENGINQVQVVVSNNGSNDLTTKVLDKYANKLNLKIIGFNKNNGFDENYINCIRHSEGRYVWVMGDDDCLTSGAISKVLAEIVDSDCDLYVCNGGDYKKNILKSRLKSFTPQIDDTFDLIDFFGWHICWIGTCILRRNKVNLDLLRASDLNSFVHIPIILRSFDESSDFKYIPEVLLHTTINNSEYFKDPNKLIKLFGYCLNDTLSQFIGTKITNKNKKSALRGFNKHLGMFSFLYFLSTRKNGKLSIKNFLMLIPGMFRLNPFSFLFITIYLFPTFFIRWLINMKNCLIAK